MRRMPSNKKPSKKYRPKYAKGQIPVTIRHSADSDLHLQVIPHQELESLRDGTATEYAYNTLSLRLNWGYVMAGEIFDNPDARQVMEAGLAAIRGVRERFERVGKYGVSGEEFKSLGEALNLTDEMQKSATRREQHEALRVVYAVNDLKQKGVL